MTIRRYYDDSYTWRFEANAVEVSGGDRPPFAVLDASYFYPTSGGQPHDTGRLGRAGVLEVTIRPSDGALIHRLDAPIAAGPVEGAIDGARRFDHMQQHTGQHILSQAFLRIANAPTIGFHLGAETVSIDLDAAQLPEARIAEAAEVANQLVSANVPVRAWFPTPAELEALALRKMPDVDGPVRIVAIGDFDFSACGGTHVARSGEVGMLSILRVERLKRGTRIEFLAGHRARADYARKHAIVRELSGALTCAPTELPEAVARLSGALGEVRRDLAAYRERDLDDEAARLLGDATPEGVLRVVRAAWASRPADEVKGLALRLTGPPGVVALFGVAGPRTQLLFARSEGVSLDLRPCFDRALAALGGGKGGGSRLLQGAAGPAEVGEVEAALCTAEAELRGETT